MHWLTSIPDYIGAGIYCFGLLMIITTAFQKSTGTGIAMLLFGAIIWPFYVLLNWKETSYWFFWCLAGSLIVYIF